MATEIPSSSPSASIEPTNHYKPSSSPSVSASPTPAPTPNPTSEPTVKGATLQPTRAQASPTANPTAAPVTAAPNTPQPTELETLEPTRFDEIPTDEDGLCIGPGGDKSKPLSFEEESTSHTECKDAADPWRTCIWRTTSVEKCDRMVKAKPYVGDDESLIDGTMTITLSQNTQATSCKNMIQMEKLLLTYLADNVGSDDGFEIACVYTTHNDREGKELYSGKSVESTALEYRLTFIQKNKDNNRLFQRGRRTNKRIKRRLEECTDIDEAMCCSQYAINGEFGEYCTNKGCTPTICGKGRRERKEQVGRDARYLQTETAGALVEAKKPEKDPKFKLFWKRTVESRPKPIPEPYIGQQPGVNPCTFYGELAEKDWNDSVRTYSEFKPKASRSLVDVGFAKAVAFCNVNSYSIENYGVPALACSEYKLWKCVENEDLIAEGNPADRMFQIEASLNQQGEDPVSGEDQLSSAAFDVMEDSQIEDEAVDDSEKDVFDGILGSLTRWRPEKSSGNRTSLGHYLAVVGSSFSLVLYLCHF